MILITIPLFVIYGYSKYIVIVTGYCSRLILMIINKYLHKWSTLLKIRIS